LPWIPNKVRVPHILAAVALASGSAALADVLVVRSTGPSAKSYPPGKRLAETARIRLQARDLVVVLNGNGTRNLTGPGTFTVGAPPSARTAQNNASGDRRARIGAVRGPGEQEVRAPSIWHVDVAKSSNVCVAPAQPITLWRLDPTRPVALNITRVSDGATRKVNWAAGSSTVTWPAALSVTDGAEYRLSWAGAAAPTTLRVRALSQKPSGLEDLASSLIANQCDAQLELFIETVRLPDDAPSG
jgi:hypothetical protein